MKTPAQIARLLGWPAETPVAVGTATIPPGPCGDTGPVVAGGLLSCDLRAGHAGMHEGDGASWTWSPEPSRPTPVEPSRSPGERPWPRLKVIHGRITGRWRWRVVAPNGYWLDHGVTGGQPQALAVGLAALAAQTAAWVADDPDVVLPGA